MKHLLDIDVLSSSGPPHEARVFLEEFFARFAKAELTGEPARMRSNELNAWKRIPVRLTAR